MRAPDLRPFLEHAQAQAAPALSRWVSPAALSERLRRGLEQSVQRRMLDEEHARAYAYGCPVTGTGWRDYQLRLVDLGPDGRVLAGVHFLGLDPERPFVGVRGRTASLRGAAHADRLVAALLKEFERFSPRAVWDFQYAPPAEWDLAGLEGAQPDQLLLVGRASELAARPALPEAERVALRPPGEDLWAWHRSVYRELEAERPDLAGRIGPTERGAWRDSVEAGLCFEVVIDGRRAGVIAGAPEVESGLSGVVVVEELLDAPWRGRGLAAAVQRAFVDQLDADSLVIGTIDAANAPSLRTALRVGREIAGRCWFLGGRP